MTTFILKYKSLMNPYVDHVFSDIILILKNLLLILFQLYLRFYKHCETHNKRAQLS